MYNTPFLAVSGSGFFAYLLVRLCVACLLRASAPVGFDGLALALGLLLQVAGSIYVYGTNPEFNNKFSNNFCDRTSYVIAHVMLGLSWTAYLAIAGTAIYSCALGCKCKTIYSSLVSRAKSTAVATAQPLV